MAKDKGSARKPEADGGAAAAAEANKAPAAGKGAGDEVVISVPVHCDGCARKLRRSLQRLDGVGEVTVDSRANTVVVTGGSAAEAVRVVERKTGEKAVLLSPSPPEKLQPPPSAAKGQGAKKLDDDGDELPGMYMKMATVLRINLHCDACCEEIKRRILKITGVEEAVPHLKSSQMMVKGMVEPATLVGFIHKCTGRKSGIIRAEPLADNLLPPPPKSDAAAPPPAAEAETTKKDEPSDNNSGEKKTDKNGEKEEKKGGGGGDGDAGGENQPKAEQQETHGGGEDARDDDDAGDGGAVVENRAKDDRLFTVPMPAGVVTVAPEMALVKNANPYYGYPPYYGYAPYCPFQYQHHYQYPQPYPAYATCGSAMNGYPHYDYPPEAFTEENPNACTIV